MQRVFLSFALLVAPAWAAAAPVRQADIPAGAKWVVHLDAPALVASGLGQYLLEQGRQQGLQGYLAIFTAVFGFDPTKDLDAITLYGRDLEPASAVAIFRGRFDQEKLLGLLEQNAGHEETAYGTYTLHRWAQKPEDPQDDGYRYGAFHSPETVVIARSAENLRDSLAALDPLDADAKQTLPVLSPGTFLFAAANDIEVPAQGGPEAQVLRKLSNGLIELGESGDTAFLRMKLGIRKLEDAERLQRALDGVVAFLSLAADHVAEAEGQTPHWAPLVAGAMVSGNAESVELSISVRTAELIKVAEADRRIKQAQKAQ